MNDVVEKLLNKREFPRSSSGRYAPDFVLDNQMGPNALWLVEWLTDAMAPLRPGMKVLDLGCGKAMTTIFLAREFGVQVWAADLWMDPDGNWRRAQEAGVGGLVYPIKAEAHALPFPTDFFDAVISVDAYQYFGTDDLYLDYLCRFLKPQGQLGVALVGLTQELDYRPGAPGGGSSGLPPHLTTPQSNGKVFWEPACRSFKTAPFWERLWQGSPAVEGVAVEAMPDGWRHWGDFEEVLERTGKNLFPSDAEAIRADQGESLAFLRLVAQRSGAPIEESHYDPALGAKVGIDG